MTEPSPTPRVAACDEKHSREPNSARYGEMLNLAEELEAETIRLRAEKANLARLLSVRCSPRVRHDDGCACVYCESLAAIAAADQPKR